MSPTPGERLVVLEERDRAKTEKLAAHDRRLDAIEEHQEAESKSKSKTFIALLAAAIAPFIAGVFGVISILVK